MAKKTKRIFSAILSLIIFASMALYPSYAAAVDPGLQIEPLWKHASRSEVDVQFGEKEIACTAMVLGYSGTTYTNGTLTLKKQVGTQMVVVKEWTNLSCSSSTFFFSEVVDAIPEPDVYYKLTLVITTVRNGETDLITHVKGAIA